MIYEFSSAGRGSFSDELLTMHVLEPRHEGRVRAERVARCAYSLSGSGHGGGAAVGSARVAGTRARSQGGAVSPYPYSRTASGTGIYRDLGVGTPVRGAEACGRAPRAPFALF